MFRIPLMQRYIFGELLRVFLFVLSCITVLLVFFGLFQQASEQGLGPDDVLQILPYIVPSMLPFTVPAALLLTISVVYGRMSGDQEVVAAKAAGVHPVSMMCPAFVLGGLLSICSLLLTDQVIPWSMSRIEQHLATIVEDLFLERLRTELQFNDPAHRLHITVTGVRGRILQDPVIRYVRDSMPITLRAEEAQIRLNLELREAVVTLNNVFLDQENQGRTYINGVHEIPIRWDSGNHDKVARHLPIRQLEAESALIRRNQEESQQRQIMLALMSLGRADFAGFGAAGMNDVPETNPMDRYYKIRTEVHSRYALACSCFFFALIGAPFSILFGKSQFLTSFLLCFVPIVAGYYPLMLGLMSQAKLGNLEPSWGMWIGNGLLIAVASFVSRRVLRY